MKYLTVSLLILGILLTIVFIAGSFIAYAPNVTATQVQNIYLGSILHWGIAILVIQVLAILSVLLPKRKPDDSGRSTIFR
jgi:hypothetical protein